jgi:hypothetical protein
MVQGIASLDAQQPQQGQMPPDAQAALGQGFSNLSQEELGHLRELSDNLKQLSPDKLQVLEQVIQFLKKNAGQYAKAVQVLVTKGIVQPGDLPPQYIPSFFEILDTMVRQAMAGGEKQGFARGGIAQLRKKASDVAKAGTGGDKVLAHINPREAAMLQATRGGGMNPSTGLPEYGFFDDIGNFFKQAAPIVLPVALGMMGVPPIFAGAIGSGVGAMINGASPKDALGAAVLGGVGGAVFSGLQNMGGEGGFMGGVSKGFEAGPGILGEQMGYKAPAVAPTATVEAGGYSGIPASTSAAVPPASSPGMFDKVGNWIKANPYPAIGIAGLGAGALGYAMNSGNESPPPMMSSQGATPEQIAAARFPAGSFTQRTAPRINVVPTYSTAYAAKGGQIDARIGGHLEGPGTGTSDSIPAKLSDGEFVMTAKAVRGAGGGDRSAGAKKMYALMHQFEKRA